MCVPVSHLRHHSGHPCQCWLQCVNYLMNQKLQSTVQYYYPSESETSTSFEQDPTHWSMAPRWHFLSIFKKLISHYPNTQSFSRAEELKSQLGKQCRVGRAWCRVNMRLVEIPALLLTCYVTSTYSVVHKYW